MLLIKTIVVTPFSQNARLMFSRTTKECVVVDPGGEASALAGMIEKEQSKSVQIWLTHSHIDHVAGVAELLSILQQVVIDEIAYYAHPNEKHFRENVSNSALMFGLSPSDYQNAPEPNISLTTNTQLQIGSDIFLPLFTPGHSPGHFSFYCENVECQLEEVEIDGSVSSCEQHKGPILIAGDALFHGSVGRTDLPGGNHQQLIDSIKSQLLTLPDETIVLCGHGPITNIGHEKKHNPFLS